MYKDLLIPFSTFPDPVPEASARAAVRFAKRIGAGISAVSFDLEFHPPANAIANMLLDLPGMVATATERAKANAISADRAFEAACRETGVTGDVRTFRCEESRVTGFVTELARLRDLTIMAALETGVQQQYVAESVIFGSGRPVLLLPAAATDVPLKTVAVAWDWSMPAARSLADALPILRMADEVRVFTVGDEKDLPSSRGFDDLKRHLGLHEVEAVCEVVDGGRRPIGDTLADYAATRGVDLLVMGAFAHSRMRDFILGGATRSVVAAPPVPVLLSH